MTSSSRTDQVILVPGIDQTQSHSIANAINTKFAKVASDIAPLNLAQLPSYQPCKQPLKVQPWEVFKELAKVQSGKSSGPDGIPAKVVKLFAIELSTPLCQVLNSSFAEHVVPKQWKKAIVAPIPKEQPATIESLRPIALTDHFAKIAEHFIVKSLLEDVNPNLDPKQFGSRSGMSTSHCLVDIINFLTKNSDRLGSVTTVIVTDFTKAFDRVDHSVIIAKLCEMCPSSSVVPWIVDFLSDRTQCVRYRGCLSEWTPIKAGVPQGTKLGPVLFLILINDALTSSGLAHWKYVDDMTIAESITRGAISEVQPTLDNLVQWCDENNMRLNVKKCHTMRVYFGKTDLLPLSVTLADHSLNQVKSVKILGVTVQSDLKWGEHVQEMVRKANKRMYMLSALLPFRIPVCDLLTIYTGFIRPLVEYAAPVWHPGLTSFQTSQIERVEKRALRLIMGSAYSSYDEALDHTRLEKLEVRRDHLCKKFAQALTKSSHFNSWFPLRRQHEGSRSLRNKTHYQQMRCRTERYRKSPIPFLIDILNNTS